MKLLILTWNVFKPTMLLLVAGLALIYIVLNLMVLAMIVLTEVLNAA